MPSTERRYLVALEKDIPGTVKLVSYDTLVETMSKYLIDGYSPQEIIVAEEREFRFKITIHDPIKVKNMKQIRNH